MLLHPLFYDSLMMPRRFHWVCNSMQFKKKGVPSAESSRSVRGLGKGVSGKPYPLPVQCEETATRTRDLPVTGGKTLSLAPGPPFIAIVCNYLKLNHTQIIQICLLFFYISISSSAIT
jgi:hypothetical protein